MLPKTAFCGATVNGLSGTMLVPSIQVLEEGGARAAIHLLGDKKFDDASFKATFAFSEDSEAAVIKRFSIKGGSNDTDPVFALKYKIRANVAMAGYIDPNDDYKHSVMIITGVPGNRLVLGLGANIATDEKQKKAAFGRYNSDCTEVDPVFFVFGADLNINDDTKLTVDYAGNDFVIGLRHAFDEALCLDFGYYTPDRLNDTSRYLFGLNFGF